MSRKVWRSTARRRGAMVVREGMGRASLARVRVPNGYGATRTPPGRTARPTAQTVFVSLPKSLSAEPSRPRWRQLCGQPTRLTTRRSRSCWCRRARCRCQRRGLETGTASAKELASSRPLAAPPRRTVLFAGIPGVQPVTVIVVAAGAALGLRAGILVGGLAALVSNMFLGQGPWTPWQMLAWGGCGAVGALAAPPA